MKGQIVYIKGHKKSEEQAKVAYDSFLRYNWDMELVEGVTPETINEDEFPYPEAKNSRLADFKKQNKMVYITKKSCIFNHLRFFDKVIEQDEPMLFAEHDAICVGKPPVQLPEDYMHLAIKETFFPPGKLAIGSCQQYRTMFDDAVMGVNEYPKNFLKYKKDNAYNGATMTVGTTAYIMTPSGARKMKDAIMKNGIEQSDFQINSKTVHLQYHHPNLIRYNQNLSTSTGNLF